MQIKLSQAINQGLQIIIKNPLISALLLLFAFISTIKRPYIMSLLEELMNFLPFWLGIIISVVILLFLFALYSGIMIGTIYNLNQGVKGIGALFTGIKVALKRALIMTGATFLYSYLLIVPFVLFIISLFLIVIGIGGFILWLITFVIGLIIAIYLAVSFWYYDYAIMIDNKGMVSSLKTSWRLTKGYSNRADTFFIFLFFVVLTAIFIMPIIFFNIENIIVIYILQAFTSFLAIWSFAVFVAAYLQMTQGEKEIEKDVSEEK
jgi:hypothetical protein